MRILLLTAGFGEGHNTAARCIAEALGEHPGVKTRVVDVYMETVPRFTKVLQAGYALAINKFPIVWSAIFTLLDKPGVLEKTLPLSANLRSALSRVLEEYRPDAIVSTYPLYAFLIRHLRMQGQAAAALPLLTMVTDSTSINSSWYRAGSEAFLLADEETARTLRRGGVDPALLQVLGFPVAPRLASLTPSELPDQQVLVRRVLYLPSSRAGHALAVIRELLARPGIELTVVTGRLQGLHNAIVASGLAEEQRVRLIGWTDQMPELLCSHHLYVGKAGGAIVHEAMAARCPILVSHVVPGQEEGNIQLIERHDIGRLAAHFPAALAASVTEVFENGDATWKRWRGNLDAIAKPGASHDIAAYVISVAAG